MENQPQETKSTNPIYWIIIVIVVIGLGVAAYLIYTQDDGVDTNTANVVVNANTNTVTNTSGNVNTARNTDANSVENTVISTTSSKERFISAELQFSFQPPEDLYVVNFPSPSSRIEFNQSESSSISTDSYEDSFLIVKITTQEPTRVDGEELLLDRKPSSTRVVGGLTANVYEFTGGYEGTPAFIVFRVKIDDVYYLLEFWNTAVSTNEVNNVLDSFEFSITSP